jgi:hypothetical protein
MMPWMKDALVRIAAVVPRVVIRGLDVGLRTLARNRYQ